MQPKFCQNCGAKLKPDSKFCPNCGTKVEMIDDPKSDDHHETPVASDDKATKEVQKTDVKPKKNKVDVKELKATIKNISQKKSFKIVAAIAVVLVIVLAVALHKPKLSKVVQGSVYKVYVTEKYKGQTENYGASGYLIFSKDGRYDCPEDKKKAKAYESEPFTQAYRKSIDDDSDDEQSTYTVNDKTNVIKVHDWITSDGEVVKEGRGKLVVSKYSKDTVDVEMKGGLTWESEDLPEGDHLYYHLKKVGTVY
ncbi:MAG: zinc-ribbon domain-containing protein [Limosilactobacillus sp.]